MGEDKKSKFEVIDGAVQGPANVRPRVNFSTLPIAALAADQPLDSGRVEVKFAGIKIGTPKDWSRTHRELRARLLLLNVPGLKGRDDTFVLMGDAAKEAPEEAYYAHAYAAVTRGGDPFLILVRLDDGHEARESWSTSKERGCHLGFEAWFKLKWQPGSQSFKVEIAHGIFDEPNWPEGIIIGDILNLAFEDKTIQSRDDPVLKRVRGEA